MQQGVKIALISTGACIAAALGVIVFTCPFVHTTGLVVKGHTSMLNIEAQELTNEVNDALGGQSASGSQDLLSDATCEMIVEFDVQYFPLGKEYIYHYNTCITTPYKNSSKYVIETGDRVDIWYNPINPGNVKVSLG